MEFSKPFIHIFGLWDLERMDTVMVGARKLPPEKPIATRGFEAINPLAVRQHIDHCITFRAAQVMIHQAKLFLFAVFSDSLSNSLFTTSTYPSWYCSHYGTLICYRPGIAIFTLEKKVEDHISVTLPTRIIWPFSSPESRIPFCGTKWWMAMLLSFMIIQPFQWGEKWKLMLISKYKMNRWSESVKYPFNPWQPPVEIWNSRRIQACRSFCHW